MADQNITELPIKTNTGVANTDYMLGIDASEGYQILVRDVAKYIVENYNGSTLAGSAQTPKSAIDALNSNLREYYSGTTSFSAIDPIRPGNAQGMGNWLDVKIHANISTWQTKQLVALADVVDGPHYGSIFFKASNTYYAGIVFSYHDNTRNTVWFFKHSNGTYILRPLALPILI